MWKTVILPNQIVTLPCIVWKTAILPNKIVTLPCIVWKTVILPNQIVTLPCIVWKTAIFPNKTAIHPCTVSKTQCLRLCPYRHTISASSKHSCQIQCNKRRQCKNVHMQQVQSLQEMARACHLPSSETDFTPQCENQHHSVKCRGVVEVYVPTRCGNLEALKLPSQKTQHWSAWKRSAYMMGAATLFWWYILSILCCSNIWIFGWNV